MAKALSEAEINARLDSLDGWFRVSHRLVKEYRFETYMQGLHFALAAGELCDQADHHPEMTIGWRRVLLRFTTHDVGNRLSDKDFDAAEAIEALDIPSA